MKNIATHLICESWIHCFVGAIETQIRWAHERATGRLVVQAKTALGWENLVADEVADVREDLQTNNALSAPALWEEIEEGAAWPEWVRSTPSA